MADQDLKTDDGLRAALEALGPPAKWSEAAPAWVRRIAEMIEVIRRAPEEQRSTLEFQQALWDANWIAAVGQGNVPVDRALDDEGFRRWFAERSIVGLPQPRLNGLRTSPPSTRT